MSLNDPLASAERWLAAFNAAAARASEELDRRPDIDSRLREVGSIGAGGDRTLEIDALAEDAVFDELGRLAAEGASFTAISEERGTVAFGAGELRVVIDPIDGSVNAKRGLGHCAMSIAVADGPTVEDLVLAFVYDFGAQETFHAVRGGGAFLDGRRVAPPAKERRTDDGRLELLCIETSDARRTAAVAASLAEVAYRWRILGSIAVAMCQVATPRVDSMVNVTECRIVDAAAGALIARESGAVVRFASGESPQLDLDQRTALCVARTPTVADTLLISLGDGAHGADYG
ncbi:MAG TPA: inositol monophosphatase family protein [Solirubrobacteraceae bacterium]|nr:inositol monophosphatase family protein [Solirubrobacteraceae bacterium]